MASKFNSYIIRGNLAKKPITKPYTIASHGKVTPQKIKEAVFQMYENRFDFKNTIFLDLYSGSGQMGFEALSRGSLLNVFVELHNKRIDDIRKWVKLYAPAQSKCVYLRRPALKTFTRFLQAGGDLSGAGNAAPLEAEKQESGEQFVQTVFGPLKDFYTQTSLNQYLRRIGLAVYADPPYAEQRHDPAAQYKSALELMEAFYKALETREQTLPYNRVTLAIQVPLKAQFESEFIGLKPFIDKLSPEFHYYSRHCIIILDTGP